MELKPGYKQTEVGVIPEDWGVSCLQDIATDGGLVRGPFGGTLKKAVFVKHGYKVYEQRNAIYGTIDKGDYYIDAPKYKDLTRFCVQPGDLIVSCSGAIGCIYRIPTGAPEGVINQALLKITLDENRVDGDFFLSLFRSEPFQDRITENSHGGAMQNLVGMDVFRKTSFQLPTKAEQRAIATALSDVDALLAKLDALIAKKRDLKQAAMQQLLTGQTRLPGFSGAWEVKPFCDVLFRLNAREYQVQTSDYQETGDYPIVDQGKELIIGYSDRSDKRFRCPVGGAIVFGDHTCIVKYIDFDFVVGADGTQILTSKMDRCTRFHAFQLEYAGIPTTGYNRRFKFLKERAFLVPSLPEQTAIATVLSDMDAEIAALEARREKTRALKQGMMQELLTGRVRLI